MKFHVKQGRFLGFFALLGLTGVLAAGCISDETRGWGAPMATDDTQVVSTSKGNLSGLDTRPEPEPGWTATLSAPLDERENRIPASAISPTDTPYQGDLLYVDAEIMRIRSLTINGGQRELHLDRGYAGTSAASHAAGTQIDAFRRAWQFPDDWHIREDAADGIGGVYGAPVADEDGVLYVGDYDGWLYAFRPGDVNRDAGGNNDEPKVAVTDLEGRIVGGIALDPESGMLYAAGGDRLHAVDTGSLKGALDIGGGVIEPDPGFNFQAEDQIWTSPTLADGSLFVSSLDGNLYSLDPATGEVRWTFETDTGFMTTPVVVDGLVLVGGFNNTLYAVNADTGEQAWSFEVGNWILSTPVVSDGTAYFGDFDGILHAVNVASGSEDWAVPLNRGEIRGSPAVVDSTVVVGTDGGWLIGVDRTQQQPTWEVDVGTDLRADLVASGDEVLMAPNGCVTPPGSDTSTYYRAVDPATGELKSAIGVC